MTTTLDLQVSPRLKRPACRHQDQTTGEAVRIVNLQVGRIVRNVLQREGRAAPAPAEASAHSSRSSRGPSHS